VKHVDRFHATFDRLLAPEAIDRLILHAELLERWVRTHGVPHALYCDGSRVYHREATAKERKEGVEPRTQFGRMCQRLDIQLWRSRSPQGRGRVERSHGTHQDRLIKKMRLLGLSGYGEANRYLEETYWEEHNAQFAQSPASETDYHMRVPPRMDLRQVFCLEASRVVGHDLVVSFEGQLLQVRATRRHGPWPREAVTVRQWRDGSVELWREDRQVAFDRIAERPRRREGVPDRPRKPWKPAANHPWRGPLIAGRGTFGE